MTTPYPRTFSHIGISVPDLEKAVWVLHPSTGLVSDYAATEIVEDDSPIGEMCTDVFGANWKKI